MRGIFTRMGQAGKRAHYGFSKPRGQKMNRILQSGCVLGAALLLLAGAASAKATDSEDLHGFDESAAYRTYIADGVVLRTEALGIARMALLLNHCSGLDKEFPKHPSPPIMAVTDVAQKWLSDNPVVNKQKSATRRGAHLSLEAAFTPDELADWDRFRQSAQGKRAIDISALLLAIDQTVYSLNDSNSGVDWDWPVANLRKMADATALRQYLDKALNQVSPGSAAILAKVSAVPGENLDRSSSSQMRDDAFGYSNPSSTDPLKKAFLAQLNNADRQAMQALEQQPVARQWNGIFSAWRKFIGLHTEEEFMAAIGKPAEPIQQETVTQFCSKLKLRGCEPNSPLARGLDKARSDFQASQEDSVNMSLPREIYERVKRMPEAGCP